MSNKHPSNANMLSIRLNDLNEKIIPFYRFGKWTNVDCASPKAT